MRTRFGRDGFRIARSRGRARIAAANASCKGSVRFLALADMQKDGKQTLVRKLRLNHRNYKHELSPEPDGWHSASKYTERFWWGCAARWFAAISTDW